MEKLDIACKIATVVIALVNVSLVIYIFVKNSKRDTSHKEKERKINLLKTLVLDYGMKYFYQLFEDIEKESKRLKDKNIDEKTKKDVSNNFQSLNYTLEKRFSDLFGGINDTLRKSIIEKTDKMFDGLSNSIDNQGINLYVEAMFEEHIAKKITDSQSEVIKLLFSYSGE
jgi:hypothetical protein